MAHVLPRTKIRKPKTHRARAPHNLTQRDWRAIQRVRKLIRAILPNGEMKSLVLYGSHARGEAKPESDIDLFLVYDDVTTEQEHSLKELCVTLPDDLNRVHLFLYRADELAKHNRTSPLIYNVAHQGITLEGDPVPKLEIDRRHVTERNMELANEDLRLIPVTIEAGGYRRAVSMSYYAVLYAADAALATKGFVSQSHEGTHSLFGYHFIRYRLVDSKFKGLIKRAKDERMRADYKRDAMFTRDDAEYWFARAQEFVAAIEAEIPGWLAEG
ncbi:MAG: HEPN domain-containing protein [Chloroflexi bacterium]|nr:HEPN domain-containing protein [Chloroflexota bacterium]